MRRLTILLISLLFLVSCTSLMDDDVDRPLWYPNGRNVKGELCFTVMGEGATAAAGRDAAYNELLEELSSTLGRDVVGRYYRELASNQSISEVSLEIESTYSSITGDGRHRFFILAYADEAAIEEQQSEAFKALLESEREVEALRASSLGHYKANNDVEAIRELLRALEISSREGLESEGNSPEELLALALERLSAIEIRLSREDAGKGTVRVRVVRDHGLLSPSVAGAPVNALFKMRTHDNELVDFSVPFVTGQDGSFIFEEYYPQMVDTGTVRFTLDIGDEMDAVEAVTGEAFLYDFRRMAESVQASFDYDMDKRLRDGSVLVIMDEHDEDGHRLPTHWARDAFVSYLEGEGIEADAASLPDGDLDSAMDAVVSSYSDYDWVIWSAVGLSDVPEQSDEYTVYVAEGYTMLLDTRTLELVNLDEITRSVAWGTDREDCLRRLFSTYGSSAASVMAPYF